MDHHHFKGNDIPHIKLDPNMSIEDLVRFTQSQDLMGENLVRLQRFMQK